MRKGIRKPTAFTVLLNGLTVLIAVCFVFPILWLVISAFKPGNELFSYPLTLLPRHATLDNFVLAWNTFDVIRYTWNTLFVTITATVITVIISAMSGFALAKYHYKWVQASYIVFLSMLMLSTEVIMAPSFEVVFRLGLYDTLWGIIFPTLCTPAGIMMMRAYFAGVPDSLAEAARIDGANEGKIFMTIMLPMAKPIIVILTIFSFRWRWNDYIWPLISIDDPKKYTLQLAIANLAGALNVEWRTLLASSVTSMLPILLVFLVFQKQIMNSNINTGIK